LGFQGVRFGMARFRISIDRVAAERDQRDAARPSTVNALIAQFAAH